MKTIEWDRGLVRLIDQTKLPGEWSVIKVSGYQDMARAIREMKIRGAPALGVAAAMGVALGLQGSRAQSVRELLDELGQITETLRSTRPTAVNLVWGLERVKGVALEYAPKGVQAIVEAVVREAQLMGEEDEATNRKLGAYGAALIRDGDSVLTHCNAGGLATVTYGTALGVIRAAYEQGKRLHVFVDETRPRLQGARLTAWELQQLSIPATLITDNMAGYFMRKGRINLVVVGADRIAANGDVANKIGTYSVAVLAKENGIPFYVAAPFSRSEEHLASGDEIPIEERSGEEVTCIEGVRVAPEGVAVANPAFDVTPSRYVAGIITERGILKPPFAELAGS
ncbi:MAG: S-methyl-5-thioribose-1-phosphate isomerase [Chloroflexi bacterium]|nr:S-methyl-5-thioribose-1-phosphate isomerase [Chloroflexota bacterium]